MQLTIDIPDELAQRLRSEENRMASIIARGLRSETEGNSPLRREVIGFLARGPSPEKIISFRPSDALVERARELRWRNQEGTITPEEEAEMQEFADVDSWVSLLKAEARLHVSNAA